MRGILLLFCAIVRLLVYAVYFAYRVILFVRDLVLWAYCSFHNILLCFAFVGTADSAIVYAFFVAFMHETGPVCWCIAFLRASKSSFHISPVFLELGERGIIPPSRSRVGCGMKRRSPALFLPPPLSGSFDEADLLLAISK